MARANGVPEWRLQYNIDLESVVRGHHIYKTVWKPEIGERLVCKKNDRNKGALYDENAIHGLTLFVKERTRPAHCEVRANLQQRNERSQFAVLS